MCDCSNFCFSFVCTFGDHQSRWSFFFLAKITYREVRGVTSVWYKVELSLVIEKWSKVSYLLYFFSYFFRTFGTEDWFVLCLRQIQCCFPLSWPLSFIPPTSVVVDLVLPLNLLLNAQQDYFKISMYPNILILKEKKVKTTSYSRVYMGNYSRWLRYNYFCRVSLQIPAVSCLTVGRCFCIRFLNRKYFLLLWWAVIATLVSAGTSCQHRILLLRSVEESLFLFFQMQNYGIKICLDFTNESIYETLSLVNSILICLFAK